MPVVDDAFTLTWGSDPARAGVCVVKDGRARVVEFDQAVWQAAPSRLQTRALSAYRDLARQDPFGAWWLDACGGSQPGVRRFRLRLPPVLWERPWEAMIAALDAERWEDVSLLRQAETDTAPPHPSALTDQLRVLVWQGAETEPGLDTLDLTREFGLLRAAYDAMDAAARRAVARPEADRPVSGELLASLVSHTPSVLWLSGHAIAAPTAFLLADGTRLTPDALADTIRAARMQGARTPLYVVLWGCYTGIARGNVALEFAPAFVTALAAEGVSAVLAAQAPLGDVAARWLAMSVFEGLAAGRPLDHAVARGRGALMRTVGERLLKDPDWACPVVWCAGEPPASLAWSDARESVSQRQGLARKLWPPTFGDDIINAANRVMAGLPDRTATPVASGVWADIPRVWVTTPTPAQTDVRASWVSRVLTLQMVTERTVLWLDFTTGSAHRVLSDWAQLVHRRIEHDDDQKLFVRNAAQEVANDPEAGWRALCANEAFILAIVAPAELSPSSSSQMDGIWQALAEAPAQAVVLASNFTTARATEGWKVDTLPIFSSTSVMPDTVSTDTIDPVVAAFAVVASPVARPDAEALAGARLTAWTSAGTIVQTNAGLVMPATIAHRIAEALSDDLRHAAHRLAYELLDGPVARARLNARPIEPLFRARFHHAREAAWGDAIRAEAENLLSLYWHEHRAAALLSVFELDEVASLHREMPDEIKLWAGWAYQATGATDMAQSWLSRVTPDVFERRADESQWWLIKAEIDKSSGQPGSKRQSREDLEEAVAVIEPPADADERRQSLICRQDIARLVHFFERDPVGAVALYRDIDRDWQLDPDARLPRAITLRNLAEALADSASSPDDAQASEAARTIEDARLLLPEWTQHPVVSELEYLAGKLADRRSREAGDDAAHEATRYFERCHALALRTNYLMMAAIVDARLFWRAAGGVDLSYAFDRAAWTARAEALRLHARHAWAARSLIDGQLRAARRLDAQDDVHAARQALDDAYGLLRANPAFDEGRDRRRLVQVHAGLAVMTPADAPTWWRRLTTTHAWAASWLADPAHASATPAAAWSTVP